MDYYQRQFKYQNDYPQKPKIPVLTYDGILVYVGLAGERGLNTHGRRNGQHRIYHLEWSKHSVKCILLLLLLLRFENEVFHTQK